MDQRKRIRLTQYSTKAGWASKFATGHLEQALEGLAPESLGGFVGGMETRSDAAGYAPFGGPLVAASGGRARDLVRLLHGDGISRAVVGEVVEGAGVRVTAQGAGASLLQLVSVIGALGVLGAFAADQFGWVDPGRLSYALANFVGAGILTAVAVVEGQVGFILLQGAWSLISLWGAFVILRGRPGPRSRVE